MPDESHWSYGALKSAVDNGLLKGYDNKLNPQSYVTRAQVAAVINRAFGAVDAADISGFSDVSENDWYYADMAKALSMKTILGADGDRLLPKNNATRQEVFCIIARAMKLSSANIDALTRFGDMDKIAVWARESLAALVENDYEHGFEGKINPDGYITLAEFAQIMYNVIRKYIAKPGTYTFSAEGNVMVNCPDVVLKDCTIKGDLIVGDGVGNGDITLDNTKIEGRLLARGGGQNTVVIKNNSAVGNVIVSKTGSGAIRIKTEGGARVEYVYIDDGKDYIILEGAFDQITVDTDTPVVIRDVGVNVVNVKAEGADITIEGKTSIGAVDFDNAALDSRITVADGSNVGEMNISNPSVEVNGWGNSAVNTGSYLNTGSYFNAGIYDLLLTAKEPISVTASALNEHQIQIAFNKEMDKALAENVGLYEIKDKGTDIIALSAGAVKLIDPKTAVITLSGNDSLTYNAAAKVTVKKGIRALDGTVLASDIISGVIIEDHTAPEYVSCEVTGEKTLKITFSEPVCDGTDNASNNTANFRVDRLKPAYDPNTGTVSFSAGFSYTIESAEVSGDSVTLSLQESITEGKIQVAINASGTEAEAPVQDYAGNRVGKRDVIIDYTKDGSINTEVTVKTARYNSVTLSFSKPVTAKNIALFHGDINTEVNGSAPVSVNDGDFVDEITFAFPNDIPAEPTIFFLTIKNAEDIHGNRAASDILSEFTCGERYAPSIEVGKCRAINNEGKIIIYFSEPMNQSQMLAKVSYKVAATKGGSYTSLGEGDTVTKISGRAVLIDLSTTVDKPSVIIALIEDLKGNTLYNNDQKDPVYINDIDEEILTVQSADLIAKDKVKITYNRVLSSIITRDIYFPGFIDGETELPFVESIIINEDDNTVIVLSLNKQLSTDVKYNGSVISAATKGECFSKSILGTVLTPAQTIAVNDMVPPEIITYDHDSDPSTEPVEKVILSGNILSEMDANGNVSKNTTGTVTIYFSEPICLNSFSKITFSVEGYTVTGISNAVNKNELVLGIKANKDNTPARTTLRQEYNIADYSGNEFLCDKVLPIR